MKMTIQEVINKIRQIDSAIETVEPYDLAVQLLEEYREKILDTKVDI
jgi:hypothetical protein